MKRATQALDGQWSFQIDRDEKGEQRGWHDPGYRPERWLKVPVPGNCDTYLPELFGYAGHAWYRRAFRVRPAWRGAKVHLRFEGANYETTVWLNGRPLGSHSGGFDPFEFDITVWVDWEGDNTLAVRVDNWPRVGRVPNSLAGWWNYGGIYRSVTLLALPTLRIADVTLRAGPGAPLSVDVTVANEGSEPAQVTLTGEVLRGKERVKLNGELAAPLASVAPGDEARLHLAAEIVRARPWSPARPNLYTLRLGLKQGRTLADTREVCFGVRRFEVRGTQLLLNGEPLELRGFDRHEEYAGTGRVDPGGQLEADLRLIRQMNGNMVRMHYQAHPDLYDLADRLGVLVFAEIPAWQVGVKDGAEWSDPGVRQVAETMLRTLIGSLKNHPSVVVWSVGNECATNVDEARPLIGHLAGLARSLDPTRPIAYVGMYGAQERVFDLVDLPCVNKYRGLQAGVFGRELDEAHALAPDKPLFVTEFGHEAALGLHGEGYGTEEEQAAVLEGKWREVRKRAAYVPGGLIWCLADYWHMPMAAGLRWLNRIYFCHGVTTLERRHKKALAAVRRMFGRG